jgi:hypothetical protein
MFTRCTSAPSERRTYAMSASGLVGANSSIASICLVFRLLNVRLSLARSAIVARSSGDLMQHQLVHCLAQNALPFATHAVEPAICLPRGAVRREQQASEQVVVWLAVEAEDCPDIAANSLSIAFGSFQRGYTIVDRIGMRLLVDPYTNKPFVRLYTWKRVGGDVSDFHAIKLLKFSV